MLLTGLLNRKHIYKGDTLLFTMIPGRDDVHLISFDNQFLEGFERFDLSYCEYDAWIKGNKLEEREI